MIDYYFLAEETKVIKSTEENCNLQISIEGEEIVYASIKQTIGNFDVWKKLELTEQVLLDLSQLKHLYD